MVYPNGEDVDKTIKPGDVLIENSVFYMKLIYFEIPFTENEQISFDVGKANETEALYIPNSVITYKLKNHESKRIGVQIKLKYLDIDVDSGDFVLIGAGSEPTPREQSKAQIIAQSIKNEKEVKSIWVNADSAYLRFSIFLCISIYSKIIF
jgi:hypothetical protein